MISARPAWYSAAWRWLAMRPRHRVRTWVSAYLRPARRRRPSQKHFPITTRSTGHLPRTIPSASRLVSASSRTAGSSECNSASAYRPTKIARSPNCYRAKSKSLIGSQSRISWMRDLFDVSETDACESQTSCVIRLLSKAIADIRTAALSCMTPTGKVRHCLFGEPPTKRERCRFTRSRACRLASRSACRSSPSRSGIIIAFVRRPRGSRGNETHDQQSFVRLADKFHAAVILTQEIPTDEQLTGWRVRHKGAAWVLFLNSESEASLEALSVGAFAILPPSANPAEIIAAIRMVADGLVVFPQKLLATLSGKAEIVNVPLSENDGDVPDCRSAKWPS